MKLEEPIELLKIIAELKVLLELVKLVELKELMKVEDLLEQMVMVQLELVELVDFPKENNFES